MPKSNISINPAAKVVLPNGQVATRAQVLKMLGLNPGTPGEAWLAIVGCGSNASALLPNDAQKLLRAGKLGPV